MLLAGYRDSGGPFYTLGLLATLWSSSQYFASTAHYLYLYHYDAYINLYYSNKYVGFSVRCLKD